MATRPLVFLRSSSSRIPLLIVVGLTAAVLPVTRSAAAPTITIDQAETQLAALQTREAAAVEAYDAGRIAASQSTLRAAAAATAVTEQTARLTNTRRGLSALASIAYRTGGVDGVTSLFLGGDVATVLDRAADLNMLARTRSNQLVAFRDAQTQLEGRQRGADQRAIAARLSLEALAKAKAQIQDIVRQEQGVLSRLRADQRRALLAQQAAQHAAASRAAERRPLAPVQASSGIARIVLAAAYSQRGKPYQWGAAGPDAYDCSGLVLWAFAHAGIYLPHYTGAQYNYGTHIPPDQLQPGDIVFFSEGGSIGHDGIYAGGGLMVDANHGGGWVDVRPIAEYPGLIGGTRL